MLPRGLTSRILLAFGALALALLLTVGAALFVVLRELHQSEAEATLTNQVALVEAAIARRSAGAPLEPVIRDYSTAIADQGGFVLLQRKTGAVVVLAGNPSSAEMPVDATPNITGSLRTSDGSSYVYVEPGAAKTGGAKLLFAVPDRSAAEALADLRRALVLIVVILLLVGAPMAWLLSRSLTGPIRRLANATASLAGSGSGAGGPGGQPLPPLPLEGPQEVRLLTERFNAMAAELAVARAEEAALLANLRHDLRTPLTSIGGYAEAIADGTVSGPRAAEAARTIAGEAQRLERLVGELGVVERLRQGPSALRPEALDANAVLADAAGRFESRAAAAEVTLEAAERVPGEAPLQFAADRLAVERILQNLIENSLSVVGKGGHVWLRAMPLALPGRSPGVGISVTDDGPGFPPGTTERVFERFFRADPSRSGGGSGLGLAIVRELARAHGGEAWAENVAPHGARVTVLLPFSPVVANAGRPAAEPPAPAADAILRG